MEKKKIKFTQNCRESVDVAVNSNSTSTCHPHCLTWKYKCVCARHQRDWRQISKFFSLSLSLNILLKWRIILIYSCFPFQDINKFSMYSHFLFISVLFLFEKKNWRLLQMINYYFIIHIFLYLDFLNSFFFFILFKNFLDYFSNFPSFCKFYF